MIDTSADFRVNEAVRASNVQSMKRYSIMRRQTSEKFFTKTQTKGFAPPSSSKSPLISTLLNRIVYRVCYGENVIPSAAEVGPRSTHSTIKPYIPPEYREYEHKPHHLPLFLKEKLYKTVTTKKPIYNGVEDAVPNQGLVDQTGERSMFQQVPAESLPSIPPRRGRLSNHHSISMKEFGKISQGSIDASSSKLIDLPDVPYLSPKARQQMNGNSVPLLLTNVLLSGGINPQGLAPNDEAAVEHIINQYHVKSRQGSVAPIRSKSQPRSKKLSLDKMHNIAVSVSLIQQNKKKKEGVLALQKMNPKYTMDKVGIRLKATVGYIQVEQEETKKRVQDLLKTKNFNLFRQSTVNNMHLLKEALSYE